VPPRQATVHCTRASGEPILIWPSVCVGIVRYSNPRATSWLLRNRKFSNESSKTTRPRYPKQYPSKGICDRIEKQFQTVVLIHLPIPRRATPPRLAIRTRTERSSCGRVPQSKRTKTSRCGWRLFILVPLVLSARLVNTDRGNAGTAVTAARRTISGSVP
jgi:hypothetical protein